MLDGDPAPPEQRARPTQFLANVYFSQTARWNKMPLGAEVNFGPGDVALDGVPAPPKRGSGTTPVFGPYLLRSNGWMDEDATWHLVQPRKP